MIVFCKLKFIYMAMKDKFTKSFCKERQCKTNLLKIKKRDITNFSHSWWSNTYTFIIHSKCHTFSMVKTNSHKHVGRYTVFSSVQLTESFCQMNWRNARVMGAYVWKASQALAQEAMKQTSHLHIHLNPSFLNWQGSFKEWFMVERPIFHGLLSPWSHYTLVKSWEKEAEKN